MFTDPTPGAHLLVNLLKLSVCSFLQLLLRRQLGALSHLRARSGQHSCVTDARHFIHHAIQCQMYNPRIEYLCRNLLLEGLPFLIFWILKELPRSDVSIHAELSIYLIFNTPSFGIFQWVVKKAFR